MSVKRGPTTAERAMLLASPGLIVAIVLALTGRSPWTVWAAVGPAFLAAHILQRRWRSPTGLATTAEFDLPPNPPLRYTMVGPGVWLIMMVLLVAA